jgi:hypothetical protein
MSHQLTELEHYERELYVKAYLVGYSVLSIGRLLAFDNMGRVYRPLREAGVVSKLPRRQRFSLQPILEATFAKMKFSFAQWANSWGLDPKVAEKAINLGPWETKDPSHLEALAALKHDFNNMYLNLYDIGSVLDRKYSADRLPGPKYSVLLKWASDEDCYTATILEMPSIKGKGLTWDDSLRELKRLYNVKRRINKLEKLINSECPNV